MDGKLVSVVKLPVELDEPVHKNTIKIFEEKAFVKNIFKYSHELI